MNSTSIKVNVLFFGAAAELTGKRNEEIAFPAGVNAAGARESVLAAYPLLGERYRGSLLFSLNEEYADGGEVLKDGDELAFFPPVSGG
ncbi:MAG TPA: MoaD/ThiS family protein [Pyrinomonadaceae bacterium]|jgi:molybdopterin synthase sulfur carrier subunit|nr:MoaD/ThiS family protein [Pyrinomonadaceae bacterium]